MLAKKLFAYKEHSNTEAISINVLVVTIAGTDLLAILYGIATEGHSGAVAVPLAYFVFCQAYLN